VTKRFSLGFVSLIVVAATLATLCSGIRAHAAPPPIKIGVIVPLTGVSAPSGQAMKAAIELAAKIVNEGNSKDLAPLPLTQSAGLPNLGGAQIEPIFADSQGSPSVGQTQAVRLVTQEHVVALFGSYQSGVTKTTSEVAERYGIPFVCGDSVAAELTARGYKTFFRVTPAITEFAKVYIAFFDDLKKQGKNIKTIAVVHENTDYGTAVGDAMEAVTKGTPYQIVARIPYTASATDLSAEVNQLKAKKPDAVLFASYTSDSILFAKTMNELGFTAPAIIGDDSGFVDGTFLKTSASIMEGAMSRSSWAPPKPGTPAYKINQMYKAMGYDFDTFEAAARDMQGFWVLMDAINRAKSTNSDAIIAALKATNLSPQQLMLPYHGVKFDDKGQNVEGAAIMEQIQNGKYVVIWPSSFAQAKLEWPFVGKK